MQLFDLLISQSSIILVLKMLTTLENVKNIEIC